MYLIKQENSFCLRAYLKKPQENSCKFGLSTIPDGLNFVIKTKKRQQKSEKQSKFQAIEGIKFPKI